MNNYPKLTQQTLDVIAAYMDDEIREMIHGDTEVPGEFLTLYVTTDPSFQTLLDSEFGHNPELNSDITEWVVGEMSDIIEIDNQIDLNADLV